MRFTETNPNENYDVMRYVSENGVWEMGVYRVIFGYRVGAGLATSGCREVVYCAGANPEHVHEIRDLVRDILQAFPESERGHRISALLPSFEIKPIHKDATCVPELRRLAALARAGAL